MADTVEVLELKLEAMKVALGREYERGNHMRETLEEVASWLRQESRLYVDADGSPQPHALSILALSLKAQRAAR